MSMETSCTNFLQASCRSQLLWNTFLIVILAEVTLINLSRVAFWSDEYFEEAKVLTNFYLSINSGNGGFCFSFLPCVTLFLNWPS